MVVDKLKIASQYLLPNHLVSRLVGKVAVSHGGAFTTWLIKAFIKQFKIDMSEAQKEHASDYKTFNEFFTRPLKEGLRPIHAEENTICHPVDGTVSQLGDIEEGRCFQAKGHSFTTTELLGGAPLTAAPFEDGKFATIYLAPKDYHRIHMPVDGVLKEMIYVPGDLFSVNPLTARNVPNLFARNERVVTIFETEFGPMALVLVGATIVASIETVWSGTVTPPAGKKVTRWTYETEGENAIKLKKGEEMGRFKLGSTVVLTFPENAIEFAEECQPESVTRMGQHFANIVS